MQLIFEKSREGISQSILPVCDVAKYQFAPQLQRQTAPRLPQVSENELSRHYSQLARRSFGVNSGFYPLGSCTMKYNPKIDEEMAALSGFTAIHPLQPPRTVQGCMQVLELTGKLLCEICGMDDMTFQPSAGAHGEFTGMMMIKAYHRLRGDLGRTKIIVPDSAHGTNPASAAMNGFSIVNVPSAADGCVDIEALKSVLGDDVAGLMLTNPNTMGLFDKNILQITRLVHDAGGLNYYDGANLNAIMGVVRPGDMGFDLIHLNLHKTFATPHGGGGPGSGPVGCKKFLADFLPAPVLYHTCCALDFAAPPQSIGKVRAFWGNFLVIVKALTYLLTLGGEGVKQAAQNAVLNANYFKSLLEDDYDLAVPGICMHEFVLSLERLKKETGVTALDIAKGLLDCGVHPPTIYFPLIVHEALMIEPTETESPETMDEAAVCFKKLYKLAYKDPASLHNSPQTTPIRRPDEVAAARNLRLRYRF